MSYKLCSTGNAELLNIVDKPLDFKDSNDYSKYDELIQEFFQEPVYHGRKIRPPKRVKASRKNKQ